MTVFLFVILTLSVWRFTHLVVEDTLPLVAKPRQRIIDRKPEGNLAYLLGCTYCSSVWVAAATWAVVDPLIGISVPLPVAVAAAWSILTALGESIVDWLDRFGMPEA